MSDYLGRWFGTEAAQRQIRSTTVTGTVSNLSLAQIRALKLPLPTIEEQRRFVALEERVAAHERRCEAHLAHLDALFTSLQSRAFAGEL